jgi:hypothetical protein
MGAGKMDEDSTTTPANGGPSVPIGFNHNVIKIILPPKIFMGLRAW